MKERIYYRVLLELASALSIGGPDSELTDNDIVLDSRGLPIIPATSICGVMRSAVSGEVARAMFGYIDGEYQQQSAIRVYDFTHAGGNEAVSVRDNVALENKVAKKGAKFDRQIVERGAQFVGYLEIIDTSSCSPESIEELLARFNSEDLALGSKTTRGLGRVHVVECKRVHFALPRDKDTWLHFDMFDDEAWSNVGLIELGEGTSRDVSITLKLQQHGAVSVREYYTTPNKADFGQMVIRSDGASTSGGEPPIIPASSWAGAFRQRYADLSSNEQADMLFGYVREHDKTHARSNVFFSESELGNGEWKEITRNSIDRFTGGTKDGALFAEMTYYGGTTELAIRVKRDALQAKDDGQNARQAGACVLAPLFAAIADLHNGYLSVGGLTAVGHGLFCITSAEMVVGNKRMSNFADLLGCKDGDFAVPDIPAIVEAIDGLLDGGAA